MGWFWASPQTARQDNASTSTNIQQQQQHGDTNTNVSQCPVLHTNSMSTTSSVSQCPVMHPQGKTGTDAATNAGSPLNPLNYIPNISATEKQAGQTLDLTTERTISSIPKGNEGANWEYPSAQQMYNAMVRKGKIDSNTPEVAIESMVSVHNFLNESCWEEILKWEQKHTDETHIEPKLLKFMGRPGVLCPRARIHHWLSYVFPSKFSGELPFDRHDWIVLRGDPKSTDGEYPGYRRIRYVLEFYGGPDDENGYPTFSVDVRPALDNVVNFKDRFDHFAEEIKGKYMGSGSH